MLITLDPDPRFHEAVRERAVEAGLLGDVVHAAAVDEVEHALGGGTLPDVVIGGPGVPMADLLLLTERLRHRAPHCIVLAVALPTTATLRAALRAGIRDVLPPTFTALELADALDATGFGKPSEVLPLPGRTIALFSAKGGVGTSVLASNLALRLAALTGAPTVLADCDLASADQAVLHGLRPRFTIQDVADGAVDQDTEALEQVLLPVPDTDVRVLAGPLDPAAAEGIADGAVLDALRRLRQLVGLVVVDTASAFTDTTLTVLEHADTIVLPVSLDVLSLRSLVVTLQTFDRLGIPRENVHVVIVRADAKVGLTVDDVARTAGVSAVVGVPSSREVARSVNTATPLALYSPRSSVVRAVDELVEVLIEGVTIHGADDSTAGNGRGRLRRRWSEPSPAGPAREERPSPPVGDTARGVVAAGDGDRTDAVEAVEVAPAAPRRVRARRARTAESPTSAAGDADAVEVDDAEEGSAEVIALASPRDRLAAMPPPMLDPLPSSTDDETNPRRHRRSARS